MSIKNILFTLDLASIITHFPQLQENEHRYGIPFEISQNHPIIEMAKFD